MICLNCKKEISVLMVSSVALQSFDIENRTWSSVLELSSTLSVQCPQCFAEYDVEDFDNGDIVLLD